MGNEQSSPHKAQGLELRVSLFQPLAQPLVAPLCLFLRYSRALCHCVCVCMCVYVCVCVCMCVCERESLCGLGTRV